MDHDTKTALNIVRENVETLRKIASEQVMGVTEAQKLMLDTIEALGFAVAAIAEARA